MREGEVKNNHSLYKDTFQKYDPCGTGKISLNNVVSILGEIGRQASRSEVIQILNHITGIDQEDRDDVTFNEFISIVSLANTNFVSEEEIYLVFRYFDHDGDGYINHAELKSLYSSLGDLPTEEEIAEMIREADQDGDGKVSYSEFVDIISHTSHHKNTPTTQISPSNTGQSNFEEQFQEEPEPLQKTPDEEDILRRERDTEEDRKTIFKKMTNRRRSCYDLLSMPHAFSRKSKHRASLPNFTPLGDTTNSEPTSKQGLRSSSSATLLRGFFKKKKMSR